MIKKFVWSSNPTAHHGKIRKIYLDAKNQTSSWTHTSFISWLFVSIFFNIFIFI